MIHTDRFFGKTILIVEDEYFLADELRQKLEECGADVAGPVGRVSLALKLLASAAIDAAILDVHLGRELVFPVAEELASRKIPFVFATGYRASIIPPAFNTIPVCEKPTSLDEIASALFRD